MCGRYYIASEDAGEEMRALIDEVNRRIRDTGANDTLAKGEVFPTNIAPVIANNKRLEKRAFPMRWGMYAEYSKSPIINARSETAAQKPMFKLLWTQRRCLVPAVGYYEWEKRPEGKLKYACRARAGIIRMAGLYRPRAEGGFADFVILTRPAPQLLSFMHPRMPVILAGDAAEAWLDTNADPSEAIKQALGDDDIIYTPA